MKTITIRLTSPLQSYGGQVQFAYRTTNDYPTKSAIIGLLAAALGYHRDDKRITQLNDLQYAVRVDQPGVILTEFQTVERKKGVRKLTYRDFLQDAVFVVAVGSDNDELVDELQYALKHPRFQPFLGRRASVPAGVLQISNFDDQGPTAALEALPWQASVWYQKKHRRQEHVGVDLVADAQLLPDRPVSLKRDHVESFDQRNRQFSYRPVGEKRIRLDNPNYQPQSVDTDHDAFNNF